MCAAGNTDILNITPKIRELIRTEAISEGILFLSVTGSTVSLTTIEYEPGLAGELKPILQTLLPYWEKYVHKAI